MKKLYFIITLLLLVSSLSFGDVVGDTESMTPSDVNIFSKTRNIGRLLKTANYIINNLMDEEQRTELLAEKNAFRDKTGIDLLDENSLKNFGIDTSRPVSFAMFSKDNQDEVMLFFIPVLDEKSFPQKFIEVLKKSSAGSGNDEILNVTAKHKNIVVYQIKNDMYAASMNGYFVIGSTSDIVAKAVDVRDDRNGSLMLTAEYKDYISREKNNYDINAFITRKFFEELDSSPQGGESYSNLLRNELILAQGTADNDAGSFDKNAFFKSIDYVSAGMGFDGNKFQLNGSAKLSSDNPYVEMILGLLKTGENGKALFVQNADSNIFLALNYKYLDNLCAGGLPVCEQYNQFKTELKNQGNIDFEKDFLPYYSGVMNIISIDSAASGGVGDIAIFLPMNDAKKTEDIWKKLKVIVQAKYGKDKKFGEEKIDGKKSFWYIDESQMRFFVTCDGRGIYAGNSTGLIKSALKSDSMDKAQNTGRLGQLLNDKTFFLVNIKKNNFLRSMLMMRAQGTPGLGSGLSRIGEINLFCEKKDKLISLDFDIEIKEVKKKGK